ncbi:MAG: modulator of FtsH protease HflK [Acidobacteriota bacterium]|jgi:membrane protease subunit HflK
MSDDEIVDLNRWDSHVPHMPRVPRVSGPLLRAAAAIIAVLILITTTFYQVPPEAVGVVLRFGRYVRTAEPGLHVKAPFAEEVIKVPVQRQLKQEFGFRTEEAAIRTQYSKGNFTDESMMLTGDLNVAIVEWIVQYRVSDPYQFLFKVRNPEGTFRAMNEAVMRQVVGDRTVTEVLTVGRQEIETRVEVELQAMAKQYELGITLDQVVLQDVNPPNPVKPSWDAVNQAQQQRDRLINEARAEYNKVVPRAKGEAEQAILQAQGYALDRVNRSQGDSARFKSVYDSYRKAPEVTRRRMYLETMGRVLPNLGGKVFLDKDVKGLLPLLPLQNMMGESTKAGGGL